MGMTCYTDWKFIRAGNYSKAKGLLKYLTYTLPGTVARWDSLTG
jgi:hypothetical protein